MQKDTIKDEPSAHQETSSTDIVRIVLFVRFCRLLYNKSSGKECLQTGKMQSVKYETVEIFLGNHTIVRDVFLGGKSNSN